MGTQLATIAIVQKYAMVVSDPVTTICQYKTILIEDRDKNTIIYLYEIGGMY